jgi:hypothetical protein
MHQCNAYYIVRMLAKNGIPMMNASWTKTSLDDLKAPSFTQDHVLEWDADVVEFDLCVTMWSILLSIAFNKWHTSYPITVV